MRQFSLFLVIALILGTPSAGAATITPGSSCKSAGQTATFKGKSYKCIKLGKKLYWNNGIPIKKIGNSILDIPASCNVAATTWVIEVSDLWEEHRDLWFSAMLVNASTKNMATDIAVYVDYYDSFGVFKKEKISVPKLFPGQTLSFGGSSIFTEKKYPTDIKLRSTCKSKTWKRYKIITGKSPVSVEQSTEEFSGNYGGRLREIKQTDVSLKSRIIIENIYTQPLTCNQETCNFGIYGWFKDTFGNSYGGISTDYLSESFENEIEPGETGYIDIQAGALLTDVPLYIWLPRITQLDFTLIPKF